MNEDDEAAALAHQQELEHRRWTLEGIIDELTAEGERVSRKRKEWFDEPERAA